MKRTPHTASLFPEPMVDATRRAAAPVPPAAPVAPPMKAVTRELWAALQWSQPAPPQAAIEAQDFTPRVSLEPPDALLLELRGSLGLFGGLQPLFAQLQSRFPEAAAIALAPTPLAALVLARAGKSCCLVDATRLVSRLSPLPLRCLRWPEQAITRLSSMGVHTIGEALRLPRAGFAQRFGTVLLESLDRLVGRRADPRKAFRPEERFHLRCEPSFELADKAFVLHTITPALQALEGFLQERQRGITALLLRLEHRGRPASRCVLRLAAPEHRASQFAYLLESRLQSLVLPAAVRCCELRSGGLLEYAAASDALWQPGEQGGGAGARMPAFLERLRARLGPDSVHGLCVLADHRPERLSREAEPVLKAAPASAVMPWASGRRPLWLLREPCPLVATQDGSGYPGHRGSRLALLAGPERLETGWWDGSDIERDYYVAADGEGARLWIFRERSGARGWYLHGHFG